MRNVRHSSRARRDLIDIWLGIASDNPDAADRVYGRLERRIEILSLFPELGPARPDIDPDARILIESPYLIFYRILADAVQIVRVLHGARHIGAASFDDGVE